MSGRFVLHRAPRRAVLPQRRRRENLPQEVTWQPAVSSANPCANVSCRAFLSTGMGNLGGWIEHEGNRRGDHHRVDNHQRWHCPA